MTISEYEFILTADGMSEFEVKAYCTRILRPCKQTAEKWNKEKRESADIYFGGYFTFKKIGENQYKYYVLEPFCD